MTCECKMNRRILGALPPGFCTPRETVNQPDKCRSCGKPSEGMLCSECDGDQHIAERAADPCAGCRHAERAIALEAELCALRAYASWAWLRDPQVNLPAEQAEAVKNALLTSKL